MSRKRWGGVGSKNNKMTRKEGEVAIEAAPEKNEASSKRTN